MICNIEIIATWLSVMRASQVDLTTIATRRSNKLLRREEARLATEWLGRR